MHAQLVLSCWISVYHQFFQPPLVWDRSIVTVSAVARCLLCGLKEDVEGEKGTVGVEGGAQCQSSERFILRYWGGVWTSMWIPCFLAIVIAVGLPSESKSVCEFVYICLSSGESRSEEPGAKISIKKTQNSVCVNSYTQNNLLKCHLKPLRLIWAFRRPLTSN